MCMIIRAGKPANCPNLLHYYSDAAPLIHGNKIKAKTRLQRYTAQS